MKKLMTRIALSAGTIGVIVGGAAAFSAFEAHVINVTARIENALLVDTTPIEFGTVFPQEQLDETFNVVLSRSFMDEQRVDDVSYTIRQKPKCGLPNPQTPQGQPVEYLQYAQVIGEDENGNFICPEGFVPLPLLCPYLSKHELTEDGTETDNDTGINAFHGLPGPWTIDTTLATAVFGRLSKFAQDTADTWNLDLKVPCFDGFCAQDWDEYVTRINAQANPDDYVADPSLQHEIFGCDIWLEVNGVSRNGKLTVDKVVEGGQLADSDFSLFVNGSPVTDEVANILPAGPYTVSETTVPGYDTSFSGACDNNGNVNLGVGDDVTCTITNTFLLVETQPE